MKYSANTMKNLVLFYRVIKLNVKRAYNAKRALE